MITCQNFLREVCEDNSVSLRDVKRVVTLFSFFKKTYNEDQDALILTIYLCYFCRLPDRNHKGYAEQTAPGHSRFTI
jgi:hypothetical protein